MATKYFFHIFSRMRMNHLLQVNFLSSPVNNPCVRHLALKPVFHKIHRYSNNIAVIDSNGTYTYGDIICFSNKIHQKITSSFVNRSSSMNVALLCPNDASYVGCLIGCWLSGNAVVPLCKDHPSSYLEYFLKDSQADLVIVNKTLSEYIKPLAKELKLPILEIESPIPEDNDDHLSKVNTKNFDIDGLDNFQDQRAMLIYTSGTTGAPKGVVLTHGNFCAQVSALVNAWSWTSNDIILHALPLYHVHGIMNALLCPLDVGACIVMLPKFGTVLVWEHLLGLHKKGKRINMFFGVPTMYKKLLEAFEDISASNKISRECCRKICLEEIRLMTCGSSALPEPLFLQWKDLTGHRLLERYGMSEIGMALSNPLNGPRIPGSVGVPLSGVSACISRTDDCDQDCYVYADCEKVKCASNYQGESGNLLIKGPAVFRTYWNRPDETQASFTADGWFKTGDTACYENGYFRILGRTSVDIIKSGGYKISALDIERVMLSHPDITDCCVIGILDDTWGEKVVAFIVTKNGNEILPLNLKAWCKERLPTYCIPASFRFVTEIPRNNMGKINKKQLKTNFS